MKSMRICASTAAWDSDELGVASGRVTDVTQPLSAPLGQSGKTRDS
jgi:hypothetical protein